MKNVIIRAARSGILGCLLAASAAQAQDPDPRRFQTDPQSGAVSMQVSGKTCWTYVPQSKEGKPYFHPLAIPGSGEVLTSFRPADHAWHLGLWFSWKFINGCNFWEPDPNGQTRILAQTATPAQDKTFTAKTTLAYLVKGREAVREERTVRVETRANGAYTISWDSAFTAQGADAVFSVTPAGKNAAGRWASGGYAGLLGRFADSPAFTYNFSNPAGRVDVETCGERSESMEVVATAVASGARARIRFRDHPENPRHPTPWFTRHDPKAHGGRGYYLAGPALLFHEPLTLPAGQTLRLRYTIEVESMEKLMEKE